MVRHRPQQQRPARTALAIAAILLVAMLLRLWGLGWGLPDDMHLFSYHPDEHFSLATALSVAFGGGWNPRYFNYGPLYMHLVAAAGAVAGHLPLRDIQALPQLVPKLILDARLVTVALGVLTVALVYQVGRRLYGRTAGLMAASVLAITPLHAVHGHFATVDVPAAFWMTLALLLAVRILRREADSRGDTSGEVPFAPGRLYALAGAAAGLAAATKYNGAAALIFALVAHALCHGAQADGVRAWLRLVDRRVATAVAGLLVAFIVACPWALLSPGEWWGSIESVEGVAYELHHMRVGEQPALEATPPGPIFHLVGSLGYGLGFPLLALSLLAVGLALVRRERADWLLLSFLVLWFVMISLAKVRYMRYAIPMLPVLALLLGRLLDQLMRRVREPRAFARRAGIAALRIAAVAALCHALIYTWAYDDAMARLTGDGDPRSDCLWRAGAQEGDSVGLIWPPWFCHPPVEYVNGGAVLSANPLWSRFRRSPYEVRALGYDPPAQRPEFLVTTRFEIRDHHLADTEAWRNLSATLATYYVPVILDDPAAELGKLPGADMRRAPLDWLYPFPGISVYRLSRTSEVARDEWAGGSDVAGDEGSEGLAGVW